MNEDIFEDVVVCRDVVVRRAMAGSPENGGFVLWDDGILSFQHAPSTFAFRVTIKSAEGCEEAIVIPFHQSSLPLETSKVKSAGGNFKKATTKFPHDAGGGRGPEIFVVKMNRHDHGILHQAFEEARKFLHQKGLP